MSKGILKFINYTKEAFFWPLHLVGFGILTLVFAAACVVLPTIFGLDPTGLMFVYGGLELILLGQITRSRRFRRAITAKYGRELEAYGYLQQLTKHYNGLSAAAQRRFEALRVKLTDVKKNYSRLNASFPDLVKEYLQKIDALQLNYIRILSTHDKMPDLINRDNPALLRRQIQEIRGGMGDDSEKLRAIKEKRIKLLQSRIRNFHDANDNVKLIAEQLHTIEETVNFYKEQPLADQTRDEVGVLDALLTETNDLHNTLSEVESIMRSDLSGPGNESAALYGSSGGQEVHVE